MSERSTNDGTRLIEHDPWLEPFADALRTRHERYRNTLQRIEDTFGSLDAISRGHEYFGFTRGECDGRPGVWFREWAPRAVAMTLTGEFNDWNRMSDPLSPEAYGIWTRFFPDDEYAQRLTHGSALKVHVHTELGPMDRLPPFTRRVMPEANTNHFVGQYWQPPKPHKWRHRRPKLTGNLRVYEAHVGMATEEERVGTYTEFARDVLPRIAEAGYNAVQLMAIQEHPYYGSFGYQVSNFFAPSSRFGTPEELKKLIDKAHGLSLVVLLDLVHSHAVKNTYEGLNLFDGTQYQYFHDGGRGQHPAWDSLCFDYSKLEVLRFLLSNVRYWLEEFRFDGFRFDGVTSMMYLDHGLGRDFTSYDQYFPPHVDEDAIVYLQLANQLVHEIEPDAITIAEDMSGMVGIARPIEDDGLGFDYRLAMGLPDYWIKLLKERTDEQWHMDEIYHTLINRRQHEKHIAYAESHDQALVGDKTIAMWLMDADIYWYMNNAQPNLVIDRGVALHKMIRLLTFALGGEGWLSFMGNEFGHPEWVDFPREGNGFSYKYARRQWSLADNPHLRYHALGAFDRTMVELDAEYSVLTAWPIEKLNVHEDFKLLCFQHGPLVFAFNFHPEHAVEHYRIGVPGAGMSGEGTVDQYKLLLDTDATDFGGHALVSPDTTYPLQDTPQDHREHSIQIYLPPRTAQVLLPTTEHS